MSPLKSSRSRTVGKLLDVYKDSDLSLRGNAQSSRYNPAFPSYLRPDDDGAYLIVAMPLNGDYTDYAHYYNGEATETSRTWSATTGTGGVVEFQTSQYKFYNNAWRANNGTGGAFASTTDMTTADFEYATNVDFCFECWAYIDSGASDTALFGSSKGASLPGSSNGSMGLQVRGAGSGLTGAMQGFCLGDPDRATGGSWTYGQWNHYAITRSGSTFTYWYNGSSVGSNTQSGTMPQAICLNANSLVLGPSNPYAPTGSTNKNVYINDVRVYKGIPKYTTTFTPPSSIII